MAPDHRTTSPLRERQRATSPNRGNELDYGHDADNTVRHITRTKQLTIFSGREGTQRGWSWVLHSLAYRRSNRGRGCPVHILDTVVYGVDGAPEAVYYTANGTVASSAIGDDEGSITFAKAVGAHLRLPKRYAEAWKTATETYRAVAFTVAGEAVAIKAADVDKIRKGQGTVPTGTEALVVAVPTKAPCAEPLLSVQHTLTLEPSVAKPIHRSYRLIVLKGAAKRVPCKSSMINQKLERACKRVLQWIEAYSGARVLHLVLEFVEDALGELLLVRSSECSTTKSVPVYSRQRRSPSPSESKALRLETAKGIADELCLVRFGHRLGENSPSPTSRQVVEASGQVRGALASPGSCRRPHTAMSPAEAGGAHGAVDAEEWGFKRGDSLSSGMNELRPRTSAVGPSVVTRGGRQEIADDNIEQMFRGFAAPGECVAWEAGRSAAAGRALGSSQLGSKCHGDFCNTDLLDKIQQRAIFERQETGNGSRRLAFSPGFLDDASDGAESSAFRKRILHLDESSLQDFGVLPAEGSFTTCTPTKSAKGKRGAGRPHGSGQSGRPECIGRSERGGLSAGSDKEENSGEWKEIPLSWVVRGRQESHLITRQLRRYRRGNAEPFVEHLSGLGESSLSLGAIFPATYYRPVRVCHNCYQVYSMVDAARTKSVRHLDARAAGVRDRGDAKSHGQQPTAKRARRAVGESHGSMRGEESPTFPGLQVEPSAYTRTGEETQDARLLGAGNNGNDAVSGESLALKRAQAAINGLTRGDICELRSFSKPPPAVNMVAAALMIFLTGHGEPTVAGWLSAKRYMTNVDNLFAAIAGLDLDSLLLSQTKKLEAYAQNPAFRPDIIASVSLPASKLCAWVLGVLEAHRWRTGRGHPRIDTLREIPGLDGIDRSHAVVELRNRQGTQFPIHRSSTSPAALTASFTPALVQALPNTVLLPGARLGSLASSQGAGVSTRPGTTPQSSRVTSTLGPAVFPFPASTPAGSSRLQSGKPVSGDTLTCTFKPRGRPQPTIPQAWVPVGAGSGCMETIGSPTRAGDASSKAMRGERPIRSAEAGESSRPATRAEGQTRAGRAAIKGRQDRIAERLANATAAAPDPAGFERSEFLCADGVTLIPYAVTGTGASLLPALSSPEADGSAAAEEKSTEKQPTKEAPVAVLSFVVVHDFFDTLEKTFMLFKPLLLRYPGCQMLCFNSPGQAGTCLPPEPEGLLTNVWVAERLDELMQHVDNMGEMPLSDRPFNLLGIGNGASVATAFACRHGSGQRWKPTLRSLACVNGFATVDTQLAAVLHSVQRAYQCFPPERPDLPITFWSRFLFSEGYLKSVGPDLALNILCAVANPLAVEGMLRIVRGALNSRDLRKDLLSLALPLVLIQSTENMLVNAANVDPFLEGRRPRHVWSHQLRLRTTSAGSLRGTPAISTNKTDSAGVNSALAAARQDVGEGRAPQDGMGQRKAQPVTSSCLGPAGESSLFKSLAAGSEGVFVAWVKGGHEVRQECKRLVTDVLDLLAAPSGQTEAFFRRGSQTKSPPTGRVGITASTSKGSAPTAIASSSGGSGGGGGGGVVSAKLAGLENGEATRETDGAHTNDRQERGQEADLIGLMNGGTRPRPLENRQRGGSGYKNNRTTVGDTDGSGHGGDEGNLATADEPVRGRPAKDGRSVSPGHGYASLRKIRKQEPLPKFPASCGRGVHSPNRGVRIQENATTKSRAITAPMSLGPSGTKDHGLLQRRGRPDPDDVRDLCRKEGGPWHSPSKDCDDPSGWEFGDGGVPVGRVLSLEEAVADFDTALRNHRQGRRHQGSAPAAFPGNEDGPGSIRTKNDIDKEIPRQTNSAAARGWLDEEATSWATLPLGVGDLQDLPWRDATEEGSRKSSAGGEAAEAKAEAQPPELERRPANDIKDGRLHGGSEAAPNAFADGALQVDVGQQPKSDLQSSPAAGASLPGQKIREEKSDPDPAHPAASDDEHGIIFQDPNQRDDAREKELPPPLQSQGETAAAARETSKIRDVDTRDLVWSKPPSLNKAAALSDGAPILKSASETSDPSVIADRGPDRSDRRERVEQDGFAALGAVASHTSRAKNETLASCMPAETLLACTAPAADFAMEPDPVSTIQQRTAGDWMEGTVSGRPPPLLTAAEAEAELVEKIDRLQSKRLAAEKHEREVLNEERTQRFEQEHARRSATFAEEDRLALAAEEKRLADLRREIDHGRLQRGAEFEETDEELAKGIAGVATRAAAVTVRGMRPQHYSEAEELPEGLKKASEPRPADEVLDDMERLEARARAAGRGVNLEQFEVVEQRQRVRQVERLEILHGQTAEEKERTMLEMVARLQMFARLTLARMKVARLRDARSSNKEKTVAAIIIQSLARGHLSRNSVRRKRRMVLDDIVLGGRATAIQRVYRGRLGRAQYMTLVRDLRSRVLQRIARGFLGRRVARRKRALLARFAARASSAAKIQSAWRGKMARDSYLRTRCSWLASGEIQRVYRGHLGRRAAKRRREWETAGHGPERLKLGMRMIEDTKVAFGKQQDEIAALTRAQEKAEARVSSIHHQLTASESELSVLEGEMAEIDHLERELIQLTHERDLISRGITDAAGIPKTAKKQCGDDPFGGGDGSGGSGGGDGGGGMGGRGGNGSRRTADAYALEMQLQLKRAEREQRRQQLAAEFASTFADVADKKRQLDRLSAAVADIEATRLRKSREFGLMQRNLMELLSEQKRELDHVREKGIHLETAAATSAAAAAATAQRARDHEAKAAAMYGQTEELMKFQFMSMSLSYFSSLNMMKQMRDINADTTTAAVVGSADAAAAAAASAAAATIPSLKQTQSLGGDAVTHALALRKEQVASTRAEIEEAEMSQRHPFPTVLALWTVDDVCRWLDTLQLGEYKQAFREGKVDGSFLVELRESDLMDSIGMEHKLHLKKLLLARQKLMPLSSSEESMASAVRREDMATSIREEVPDIETAFSQARHGKKKRLEETLNIGFDIESEDEMGNTLLLIAVQQTKMPIVEFLVQRGAKVNHPNATGNTALHFAMSYDMSGKMGEFLINNGADDTIENNQGFSPYDGI